MLGLCGQTHQPRSGGSNCGEGSCAPLTHMWVCPHMNKHGLILLVDHYRLCSPLGAVKLEFHAAEVVWTDSEFVSSDKEKQEKESWSWKQIAKSSSCYHTKRNWAPLLQDCIHLLVVKDENFLFSVRNERQLTFPMQQSPATCSYCTYIIPYILQQCCTVLLPHMPHMPLLGATRYMLPKCNTSLRNTTACTARVGDIRSRTS